MVDSLATRAGPECPWAHFPIRLFRRPLCINGANFAFADGSVCFTSDEIELPVYRALATINEEKWGPLRKDPRALEESHLCLDTKSIRF
jgi:prepilin-type processing-associated H-X9-DG protein